MSDSPSFVPARGQDDPPWDPKEGRTAKKRFRKLLPWLGLAAIVALIAIGMKGKPVEVETGAVTRSALTVRVSEEGKTRIRNRYVVAAPAAGKMRRVALKAGDEVRAGETVITAIEPVVSPLLDPRAKAQAEAVVATRDAARQQAAESLEVARASLKLAIADRDRVRSVQMPGSVSKSDRDRVESEASVKAAQLRAAEFTLQVAEYELAQARTALERPKPDAAGNLAEVKSPVSGRVLKVMQESETIVTPGTQILEIGDPADLEIEAEILSRDAVAIHEGDLVDIEQWGGAQPLRGRVRRVEPAGFTKISALGVEEQRVIVLSDLVDPPKEAARLGDRFRVEVRVAVWHGEDIPVVPSGALFREGNAWKTFAFRGGKAAKVTLEVGHTDGRLTEVTSGLVPGDEVLLHPPDTVKDGTEVKKRQE
ncbi:HlyD family efflux transporter periplasmic adaptor subunit [Luteolibacter sp. LG18]|uniref:efflux RND transporter periplasmic adaptor subunit n=1 Tax=Luteolibacter sp. LG18 TaxID=2819286 RepID=UPI002B31CAE6|nr:membrane protein [Luteolibacter sp. LG18]